MFSLAGREVGDPVGVFFAVLVAEELFASGCRLLISLTSSGQIVASGHLRTSSSSTARCATKAQATNYTPPSEYASACPQLLTTAVEAVKREGPRTISGSTWTTDAPFRETSEAIQAAADKGILVQDVGCPTCHSGA